jgi:adenosylcobinamide-GDP ribazoletransferase
VTGLVAALQFLTRVPLRLDEAVAPQRMVPWFPFAGALIGAVVGGVAWVAAELVPLPVAAAIAVVFGLLLTGAFHEDGLADMADAFGAGVTTDERWAILADPRHGTYGVAALTSSVLVRVVSVASIASPPTMWIALICSHTLGRTWSVLTIAFGRPARDSGLGGGVLGQRPRPRATAAGVLLALGLATLAAGWWVGPAFVIAGLGTAIAYALARRKLGGVSGDVLGAIEQVAECLTLITICGLAQRHDVWWS